MSKIGLNEIAKVASEVTGNTPKVCKEILTASLDAIQDALSEGDSVNLIGYVAFNVEEVAERTGKCAGREWSKPAGFSVKAKLGSKFKNAIS